jgi:carbonic anhydrase
MMVSKRIRRLMSEASWERLLAGAQRTAETRVQGLSEHRPSIAVLACSDARVPPSVVFDQQAGELFVVRIAGNTASPTAIASLDYAVEHLGVDLILVLGHTHCGAVAAAATGTCSGPLAPIVNPICEIAREWPDADARLIEQLNVEHTVATLSIAPGTIGDAVRSGRLLLRGTIYDIESGSLRTVANDA